ncbi:hypothetical protein CPB83DRAFT_843102 [Crepidotus variabilis]|uniref:RING-type domain-containing protein n=1 Tax=Crepidotus variabilis TaxID=179855 RepID=A0A9P6JV03_9AGAR|nr:hypothetical protein CPB83DRAFT_843102 [Crepidotus variabilis]
MSTNDEENSDRLEYADVIAQVDQIFARLQQEIPPGRLSFKQIEDLIEGLPNVTEQQLIASADKDSTCPICFTSYLAIIAEGELASVMDSPANPAEHHGVTKLSKSWQCGHIFCRRDISKWIRDGHDSCPLCRRLLVERAEGEPQPQPQDQSGISPGTPPHVFIGEESGLDDVLRQLASAGGGFGFFHPPPSSSSGGSRSHDDDDRREYSGMYS